MKLNLCVCGVLKNAESNCCVNCNVTVVINNRNEVKAISKAANKLRIKENNRKAAKL